MLVDFQGVGNGYDGKDPWENLFIPKTDEGKKPAMVTGSKLTYRFYLQSATFSVYLSFGDEELANTLFNALKSPVWALSLGRKNCKAGSEDRRTYFAEKIWLYDVCKRE